jgi:hypothetical protein
LPTFFGRTEELALDFKVCETLVVEDVLNVRTKGLRVVDVEQRGSAYAEYGDVLIKRLAADLTSRFGRGFEWRSLYRMRGFHLV